MAEIQRKKLDFPSLEAIFNPASLAMKTLPEWDALLREARCLNILEKLAARARESSFYAEFPEQARNHLEAAAVMADRHARMVDWEVDRIRRALYGTDIPFILLKGGAYMVAGLPAGRGRKVNDVDILVPKTRIDEVEAALLAHGWESMKLDPYDQRYYRTWMHEIPPLRHVHRQTIVDVHHAILPESGRLNPSPELLWKSARPVGSSDVMVLCPEDMVLHSAAHLFQDGDLTGGLRDMLDIDSLLTQFGDSDPDFWKRLVPRAYELNLERPLYYALRYAYKLLGTPIPDSVASSVSPAAPVAPVRRAMDALAEKALLPVPESGGMLPSQAACSLLYIRAHWLRMPPSLLTRHLLHQSLRRWTENPKSVK
jgi:hypothetical protein